MLRVSLLLASTALVAATTVETGRNIPYADPSQCNGCTFLVGALEVPVKMGNATVQR